LLYFTFLKKKFHFIFLVLAATGRTMLKAGTQLAMKMDIPKAIATFIPASLAAMPAFAAQNEVLTTHQSKNIFLFSIYLIFYAFFRLFLPPYLSLLKSPLPPILLSFSELSSLSHFLSFFTAR
jgi:hypothetical protein